MGSFIAAMLLLTSSLNSMLEFTRFSISLKVSLSTSALIFKLKPFYLLGLIFIANSNYIWMSPIYLKGKSLSLREYWGFIKDPLYGYVKISNGEKSVIDTMVFQRLRRIRQLSGSEYVYPAANHTRFEHSLGVMYLAGFFAENSMNRFSDEEKELLRIAALLHDVGHGPFSHVYEALLMKHMGRTHEDITMWIISRSSIADILNGLGFNSKEVAELSVGKPVREKPYLGQVLRSAVDVDKMDFIVRDSYHTGAGYGFVDVFRMLYTMDVLDGNLAVDIKALSALEVFLIARIESFRSIYFHKTSRAVQIMLLKAMEEAKDEVGLLEFKTPEEYLAMDDYTVWSRLCDSEAARSIMQDLMRRKLLKCVYERT
ncbi:TPA: HD domain-containing protein, partial [Candidatus Bathyarchaeota archaeon]|nr:HD domain-containing protein [Candidatus Bathyarchaeota archaeon]